MKKTNKKWDKARRKYLKAICKKLIKKGYRFVEGDRKIYDGKKVVTLVASRDI